MRAMAKTSLWRNKMIDLDETLKKLIAWQYLNVATFLGVCAILILQLL